MLLDTTTLNWTTITYVVFVIATLGLISCILVATFHQTKNLMHHVIVNILFGTALGGIVATFTIGYFLALPQQESTLHFNNTFLRYDGTERDLKNDIIQPDVSLQHIFFHDGKEYAYDDCVILSEEFENSTTYFVVKCLSEDKEITIFGEDEEH